MDLFTPAREREDSLLYFVGPAARGDIDKIFAMIDSEPLGTASLAQAHAALLQDGRAVVIKVLHDGVEQSVDTDLKALKSILLAGRVLKRSKEEIDMIFNEIHARLVHRCPHQTQRQRLQGLRTQFL